MNPPDEFSRYPYLGLCYLAGSLINRNISVEILDSSALGLNEISIVECIVKKQPMIIGISIMSMTLPLCFNLIKKLTQTYPEGILVVGGAHINADPEIVKDLNVKYGFHGECEKTFSDFCELVLRGEKPKHLPGLIFYENGCLKINTPEVTDDLNKLPMPGYGLLPLDKYYSPSTSKKTISYISSRGCPYKCIYCSKLQQIKFRSLSPDKIIEQIQILVSFYGIQWVEFVDEIFTLSRQRTIEICEKIIQHKIYFQWGCGTRADKIDEELIEIMKKSGCRKIGFGVESGVERIRFLDNKKISNEQIHNAINLCRKHGIISICSYIFGHPTETEGEMKETVKFSIDLNSNFNFYNKMVPIPNSELFELAKKNQNINPDIWHQYMLGEISHPIYYPDTINKNKMDKIYRWAWLRFYLSRRNIMNNLKLLLSPSRLILSLKAFIRLASGSKYK